MTLVIGITGGIASGKSRAARMVQKPGMLLFNADAQVHDLLTHHKPCIAQIAELFSDSLVGEKIDRAILAKQVIKNADALKILEQIIHPFVHEKECQMIDRAVRNRLPAVILDIPLLFETGSAQLCDWVIAIDVAPDIQRHRAFLRAGMSAEKYSKLLARQWLADRRNAAADYVITSNLGAGKMYRDLQIMMREITTW
jgi:dephospho-CoA kinase